MLTYNPFYDRIFRLILEVELRAIIESGGRQFKVEKGQILRIPRIEGKIGSELKVEKVLMVLDGEKTKIGSPYVDGAAVVAKIIGDVKEKKVINFKYKPKKGYHRTVGHRQKKTEIEVKKIEA